MMRNLRTRRWVFFVIIAVVFVGFGTLVYLSIEEHKRWVAWCTTQGGHVAQEARPYQTFTYVDGRPVPVTQMNYTYYCLSGTTGGIISIRG